MKIKFLFYCLLFITFVFFNISVPLAGAQDKEKTGIEKELKGKEKNTEEREVDDTYNTSEKYGNGQHGHQDDDPPGWNQGKKTGWGDGDMPPGLEKKADGECKDKGGQDGSGGKNGSGGKDKNKSKNE